MLDSVLTVLRRSYVHEYAELNCVKLGTVAGGVARRRQVEGSLGIHVDQECIDFARCGKILNLSLQFSSNDSPESFIALYRRWKVMKRRIAISSPPGRTFFIFERIWLTRLLKSRESGPLSLPVASPLANVFHPTIACVFETIGTGVDSYLSR